MGRFKNIVLDWASVGPRVAFAHLLAPETRSQEIRTTPAMQYGVEKWTDWNTKKAVLEGYESHWLVYRLTSFRANAVRSAILVAKDINTGDPVPDTHPAAKMIANPNPRISMNELEFRAELFLCMAGDAYWYVNKVGDSIRLDPLRSDRVSIKAYRDKRVYFYTLPGETPVPFDEEEIVHIKNYSPSDDLFGMPVLRANARLVDTGNAYTDFNYNAMKNGMWPSGVLATEKLETAQYERLMKQIKETKEGPANARRLLVIEDGKSWTPTTPTPQDMDFMGGTNLTNQELCAGFGVSSEAIGLVPAKYENARAMKRAAWEDTIIPELNLLKGALNIQLANRHFDGIYFDYDLSQSLPMVEARRENAEEGKKYFDMGISTKAINELLGFGFDEADCPDVGVLPVALLPVGATRATERSTATELMRMPRNERARILELSARSAESDALYRSVDRKRQGWERGVADKISSLFTVESSAVVKAVTNGRKDTDAAIESQRGAWIKTLTAVYRAVIEDFGQETYDELTKRTIGGMESREYDPWDDEIKKYVNAQVASQIDYIQETTKKKIRAIVLEGIKDGSSNVQIAKSIRGVYNGWEAGTDVYRAMMIARTEVHQASGTAMHNGAKQSGVAKEKAWSDAGDNRVRDAHVANSGEGFIAFDDVFQDGAQFAGDGTDDVNCRCAMLYRSGR